MRKISPVFTDKMSSFYKGLAPAGIAKYEPIPIHTFRELVYEVAELSCLNKDYLLFYRGQTHDHRNKGGASTLYPSIYRGDSVSKDELDLRFSYLRTSAESLKHRIEEEFSGKKSLKEVSLRKHIQWSILQHYEVCPTPFLDITQSLLVACSFAFFDSSEEVILYVLGMPYNTNRISRNSEHEIINIRLLSICPPEALRPYFQEGYLAGTDGIDYRAVSKTQYDFNRRLLAKYKLMEASKFWSDGFHQLSSDTLYPENDPIFHICEKIKREANNSVSNESLGSFISMWSELEYILRTYSLDNKRFPTVSDSLRFLYRKEILSDQDINTINHIRQTRNKAVHTPQQVEMDEIIESRKLLSAILTILKQSR